MRARARSVERGEFATVTTAEGARAHRDHVAQSEILRRQFVTVRPGVWCFVGNGLSNQSFLEGPEGIIAIDTGESRQEMHEALRQLRQHSTRPIAAVIYTHFHYVEGTEAIFEEANHVDDLAIYGHGRIALNRSRIATEIAPAYARGVCEQFGLFLPSDGPDALVNDGLGLYFRSPDHAPFTPGHRPVTRELHDGDQVTIAGLRVKVDEAPSDSDDSITLFFEELDLCVHNLIWPTLFNVFAIRGEEYRDPRVLLTGIDRLRERRATYLVGTHGPPLVGRDENDERTERYRDSLQFLWDQTVRGLNAGATADELAESVRLPEHFDVDYLTSERYGVAEHHVRQIASGLRGWFDGDEAKLLPLEPLERFDRLIDGFGGRDRVGTLARESLADGDVRWATELATWLARSRAASAADRQLLADCLRAVAQRTPAANVRHWCLARARHLEGSTPLDFLFRHRINVRQLASMRLVDVLSKLGVTLDPARAEGLNLHVRLRVDDEVAGLHLRRCVAVVTDGVGADHSLSLSREALGELLSGAVSVSELLERPGVAEEGARSAIATLLSTFELEGLRP